MTLKDKIKKNEGFRDKVYEDTLGYPTIGYGFLVSSLTPNELTLNNGKVEPMSRAVANEILNLKLCKLERDVFEAFGWLRDKPRNIQEVVIEMCYQIGVAKVKKFVTTMHHIRVGEYRAAYENGMKSLWAKQTPNRAQRVLNGLFK